MRGRGYAEKRESGDVLSRFSAYILLFLLLCNFFLAI